MTWKCGKNNEVTTHEPQASVSLCEVFTTVWRPLWSINEQTHGNMESLFLFFFFFILIVYSFFENFFNVFPCSKQNNGETYYKTASLS